VGQCTGGAGAGCKKSKKNSFEVDCETGGGGGGMLVFCREETPQGVGGKKTVELGAVLGVLAQAY